MLRPKATNKAQYYWMSALCGCGWAGLAYLLSWGVFGFNIVGGLIASPFIGLLVGFIYLPAYRLPKVGQVFVSLALLYLAVALFGLAVGMYDAFWRAIPDRIQSEVILQSAMAALWGVTFTGYLLLLWPLAFFNHKLLRSRSINHSIS